MKATQANELSNSLFYSIDATFDKFSPSFLSNNYTKTQIMEVKNNKLASRIRLTGLLIVLFGSVIQAQTNTQTLKSFDKIVVSPKIELELVSGEEETIRLDCRNIDEHKVNVVVKGKTLRLYLDDAKYIVKNGRRFRYENQKGWQDKRMYKDDVRVKAYVTFKTLKRLQVRGSEDIEISSAINNDRFKLKLYGENVIRMAELNTDKFKAVMIGENKLDIRKGKAKKQKYKSIGENWVRADGLDSDLAKASMIGEGMVKLKVDSQLRVSTIGESQVVFNGNPVVKRGLIIGKAEIRKDW